ncbi:MAG: hypothetical protein H7Y08_06650 [Rhizobiaceae bacterium]|nr:hypothetical protein [Rhizobiaceae bacterium]
MELSFAKDIPEAPDLIHRVRHLGYFRQQFEASARAIAARGGYRVSLDKVRLTQLFLDWHESFLAQRAASEIDRRDYVVFSAGTMLMHILKSDVLVATRLGGDNAVSKLTPEAAAIIAFWPEGFIATSYCVSMLETVLSQEGLEPIRLDDAIADLRTWWSFRENAVEDPSRIVGFFDRFVGSQPNWNMPGAALARPALSSLVPGQTALQ